MTDELNLPDNLREAEKHLKKTRISMAGGFTKTYLERALTALSEAREENKRLNKVFLNGINLISGFADVKLDGVAELAYDLFAESVEKVIEEAEDALPKKTDEK